jgi:hypothetical protein
MSLTTLAQEAVDRHAATRAALAVAAGGAPPATTVTREDALSALAKYIPTEVVTLYLFGLSVAGSTGTTPATAGCWLYWGLLAFTPLCFWLIFAAKFRAADPAKAWPRSGNVPWFRLFAATVGFAVWALAVPKSGLPISETLEVWIGFGALGISTVLSLLERLFEP